MPTDTLTRLGRPDHSYLPRFQTPIVAFPVPQCIELFCIFRWAGYPSLLLQHPSYFIILDPRIRNKLTYGSHNGLRGPHPSATQEDTEA